MGVVDFGVELSRCLGCKAKPCYNACPAGVSPYEFIKYAKEGDFISAAKVILDKNPLAQTCGLICPDYYCQKACIRKKIDKSIEIPCLQALIMQKAGLSKIDIPKFNGKTIAVIGAGPAGIGAIYQLILNGYKVELFEKSDQVGGAMNLIPEARLPKNVVNAEISRIIDNDRVKIHLETNLEDIYSLKDKYHNIIVAIGQNIHRNLGINGEDLSIQYDEYLSDTTKYKPLKVGVVGGGEVAFDCVASLVNNGCENVEMFVRRNISDMRISQKDFEYLENNKVKVNYLASLQEITPNKGKLNLKIIKNSIDENNKAKPIVGSEYVQNDYDMIITALGSYYKKEDLFDNIYMAGDMLGNNGTVVSALASGINVAKKMIEEDK